MVVDHDGFTSAGRDRLIPIRTAADSANRNGVLIGNRQLLNLVACKIRVEREALYKHEQVSAAHGELLKLLEAEMARR